MFHRKLFQVFLKQKQVSKLRNINVVLIYSIRLHLKVVLNCHLFRKITGTMCNLLEIL